MKRKRAEAKAMRENKAAYNLGVQASPDGTEAGYELAVREFFDAALANGRVAQQPPDEDLVIEAWFEKMHCFGTQGLIDALKKRGKLEELLENFERKGIGDNLLKTLPLPMLFDALIARAGYYAQYAHAAALTLRKGQDYNRIAADGEDASGKERDAYFPFGALSYAQMIHVKASRVRSLSLVQGQAQFEGLRDTILDLMNYCAFFADWLQRQEAAEKSE